MSNVIKAHNIRYTAEKKKIDLNQRAEEFRQLYIENLPKIQELENPEEHDLQEEYFAAAEEEAAAGEAAISEADREILSQELEKMRLAAEEECRRLRESTQAECDELIKESQKKADTERATLLLAARKEGYNDGKKLALSEVDEMKAKLQQQIDENEAEYQKKVAELEPDFVELVISLIRKITGILVEDRRDIILHIIRQSMLGMENSKSFIIRVSKDDYDFVNSKKQDLLYELRGNSIEVVEDPILQRAQCTIETDTRILDCSLDVQLKNLIADLKLLSGGSL